MRTAVAGVCLLLSAGSAIADPGTGSLIDRSRGQVQESQTDAPRAAELVMNSFARCKAGQDKRAAARALDLPLATPEQAQAINKMMEGREDRCMGVGYQGLRFSPTAMTGGMAEQLILTELKEVDEAPLGTLSDDQLDQIGLAPRNALEDVARCLVQKSPAGVRALVRSNVASEGEARAVGVLVPFLPQCLPSGQTLTLTPAAIRSITAVGLYRGLAQLKANAQLAASTPSK